MNEVSDQVLVKNSIANPESFGGIMERYEKKLIAYVRRFVGANAENAEDIVQEVFIKTYKNLRGYDESYKFSSWIYRIAHNEAVNWYKKHRNMPVSSLDAEDEDGIRMLDSLASEVNLEVEVGGNDMRERINNVINMLSPDFREILLLRYVEERSYAEISDILHKPEGTVSVIIGRAKKQFKMLAEKNNLTK